MVQPPKGGPEKKLSGPAVGGPVNLGGRWVVETPVALGGKFPREKHRGWWGGETIAEKQRTAAFLLCEMTVPNMIRSLCTLRT